MKENINERIIEILEATHKNPGGMMGELDSSYNTFRIYIEGIMVGLEISFKKNLMKDMTLFFVKTRKIKSYSTGWSFLIKHMNEDKSDEYLKGVLIDFAKEFFNQNPNWWVSGTPA